MNYLALLEYSYKKYCDFFKERDISRLYYLADEIFDFTTYDSEAGELFATKALEVCAVISDRRTHNYIGNHDQYQWFLIMCNMPFFKNRLGWGTSIRGAWWDFKPQTVNNCGFYENDKQLKEPLVISPAEWPLFIAALIQFAAVKS